MFLRGGKKRKRKRCQQVQHTNIPEKPWRLSIDFPSLNFSRITHWERLIWVFLFFIFSSYNFVILWCWSHYPTTEKTKKQKGKRILFNRSKHVSVAEWIKKQLSLSCCALTAFVASRHARPLLTSPSTFILITPRIACWHVLKSAAPRECAAKHSLHEPSIWSTGSL